MTIEDVALAPGETGADAVEEYRMLVGDELRASDSGDQRDVIDPASGIPFARVPEATEDDVTRAVSAARRAFDSWGEWSPRARSRVLLRIAAELEAHLEELAVLESRNNGKPVRECRLLDIPLAIECFEYYGALIGSSGGRVAPSAEDVLSLTYREPVGVVGAITPFNFPLMLATWKLAPALAAGNAVVIKPSPETPLSTLRLAELCLDAGLPPGVVNVITGGSEAGSALVRAPGVDKVSFTGSTDAGRLVAAQAGELLRPVALELGGKAPNIVLADADLDRAVEGSLFGVYWTQGQVCTAGSRIFVQDPLYDDFVSAFVERARRLRVGHPLDERTEVGPLISERQRRRVLDYLDIGVREGAGPVLVGGPPTDPSLTGGYYVRPAVFEGVTNDMRIAREEIFGPVASIIRFHDIAEVVSAANDTEFGLSAGIWTRDVALAHRIARRIRAGTVWVNTYNVITPAAPFGGVKASGWGRENGPEGLLEFSDAKHVYVDLAARRAPWFGRGS